MNKSKYAQSILLFLPVSSIDQRKYLQIYGDHLILNTQGNRILAFYICCVSLSGKELELIIHNWFVLLLHIYIYFSITVDVLIESSIIFVYVEGGDTYIYVG